jgi:hypothetical protein
MRIRNALNPARAQAVADTRYVQIVPTQVELTDNTTESISFGATSRYRAISIQYAFVLPISGKSQTGEIHISQDGGAIRILSHEYNYDEAFGEFAGLDFSVSINGSSNIILEIALTAIGENPVFSYKSIDWPVGLL